MEKKQTIINKIIMITMFFTLSVFALFGSANKIQAKEYFPTEVDWSRNYAQYKMMSEYDYFFIDYIDLDLQFKDKYVDTSFQPSITENLLDLSSIEGKSVTNNLGITMSYNNNTFTLSGTATQSGQGPILTDNLNLTLEAGTYTLSALDITGTPIGLIFLGTSEWDNNLYLSLSEYDNRRSDTITLNQTTTYNFIRLWTNVATYNCSFKLMLVRSSTPPTEYKPRYICNEEMGNYTSNFNNTLKSGTQTFTPIYQNSKCRINFSNIIDPIHFHITDKDELKKIWGKIYYISEENQNPYEDINRQFLLYLPNYEEFIPILRDIEFDVYYTIHFNNTLSFRFNILIINNNGSDDNVLDTVYFNNNYFSTLLGTSYTTIAYRFNLDEYIQFNEIKFYYDASYDSPYYFSLNFNFYHNDDITGGNNLNASNNDYKISCNAWYDWKCQFYNVFMGMISDVPILNGLYSLAKGSIQSVASLAEILVEAKEVAFFGAIIIAGIGYHFIKEMKQ